MSSTVSAVQNGQHMGPYASAFRSLFVSSPEQTRRSTPPAAPGTRDLGRKPFPNVLGIFTRTVMVPPHRFKMMMVVQNGQHRGPYASAFRSLFVGSAKETQRQTPPNAEEGQPKEPRWPKVRYYLVIPFAAGAGIVVPYRLFELKSAIQTKTKLPPCSPLEALKKGVMEGSRPIAATVGLQFLGQDLCEEGFKWWSGSEQPLTYSQIMLSTGVVTGASIPGLVVFNATTMNKKAMEALRGFTPKQGLALGFRELFFLLSQRLSGPASSYAMQNAGDDESVKWFVKHASRFGTGAFGSLMGHPCDVIFTRLQKGMAVGKPLTWGAGAVPRTLGAGAFTVGYNAIKDALT